MQCALWISIFSAEVDVPTRFADEGRDADVRDGLLRLEEVDGPLVSSVDFNRTSRLWPRAAWLDAGQHSAMKTRFARLPKCAI
jgi:hypothetical protein